MGTFLSHSVVKYSSLSLKMKFRNRQNCHFGHLGMYKKPADVLVSDLQKSIFLMMGLLCLLFIDGFSCYNLSIFMSGVQRYC